MLGKKLSPRIPGLVAFAEEVVPTGVAYIAANISVVAVAITPKQAGAYVSGFARFPKYRFPQ
jgi:hypothetical protein